MHVIQAFCGLSNEVIVIYIAYTCKFINNICYIFPHSQKHASCSKSAITKPISGCVRIAFSGLMITSLLQVVNRLAESCELHGGLIDASCFINLQQVCKYQVAASLMFTDLMKSTGLIQLVGNLHQAGKIHNLHQVWRFWLCSIPYQNIHGYLSTQQNDNPPSYIRKKVYLLKWFYFKHEVYG